MMVPRQRQCEGGWGAPRGHRHPAVVEVHSARQERGLRVEGAPRAEQPLQVLGLVAVVEGKRKLLGVDAAAAGLASAAAAVVLVV